MTIFLPDALPDTPIANLPPIPSAPIVAVLEDPLLPEAGRSWQPQNIRVPLSGVGRVTGAEALRGPDTSRPTDIAEATYGPPPPMEEALIGRDDRLRVPDTTQYPFSALASLHITGPTGDTYLGTGWFIGPRILVTAGHCVFVHDRHGRFADWVRAIRVMPARDGRAMPYVATSSDFRSVVGWARDKDPRYDYGVILLSTDLGSQVGALGFAALSDEGLLGQTVTISGYPGDKVDELDGTQWYDHRHIQGTDARQLHYAIDTWGGQSGSAVFLWRDGKPYAVGIHAYGHSLYGNSATRITAEVHANLKAWKG